MCATEPLLLRVDRPRVPRPDEPASAAALLNVSDKTAWRLVRDGKLKRVKVAGRTLVTAASVHEYADHGDL